MGERLPAFVVGDELVVRNQLTGWTVIKIQKITKTGRLNCGHYTLNPDLTVRGSKGSYGPYQAQIITDEIREQIRRRKHLLVVDSFNWNEASDDFLASVCLMIHEHRRNR